MPKNTTGNYNTAVGAQSNENVTTGYYNTAIGARCNLNLTTGESNIAVGEETLMLNQIGNANTALGSSAMRLSGTNVSNNVAIGSNAGLFLQSNGNSIIGKNAGLVNPITGDNNTLLGYESDMSAGTLTNATAIGSYAYVAQSNSLVLGSINGVNGATADVNVGIGTSTPSAKLDVVGTTELNGTVTIIDGNQAAGRVLTSDASGNATWQTPTGGSNEVADGDSDTKVQVEETPDDDKIRFDLAGTEHFVLERNAAGLARIAIPNSNSSLFMGDNAGNASTTGATQNVALGQGALMLNTTEDYNTAVGYQACNKSTGKQNTGVGADALKGTTIGVENTGIGVFAGDHNISGNGNVALGWNTLNGNTLGSYNIGIGHNAGCTVNNLTNAIVIGRNATVNASNKVRIGNGSVTICEVPVAWTVSSDKNIKEDIRYDVAGLDFINKLQPATYKYIGHKGDKNAPRYTGLLAQDVEKVAQELGLSSSVVTKPNEDGTGAWGIRYAELTLPLIQSVKELSEQNDALKAEIAELKEMRAEFDEIKSLLNAKASK